MIHAWNALGGGVFVLSLVLPWAAPAVQPVNSERDMPAAPTVVSQAGQDAEREISIGDPPPMGGCCVPEEPCPWFCTPFISAPDCLAMGGIPIEDATCAGAPCDAGACCIGAGECEDDGGAGFNCEECLNVLQGMYFGGQACADDPCPTCPLPLDTHCQETFPGAGMVLISDGSIWADDFVPSTTGPLTRICWWPCWFDPIPGIDCSDDPPQPELSHMRIHTSGADSLPATLIYDAILAPDATGDFPDTPCKTYSAPIVGGPVLTAGERYWISLQGQGEPSGCQVYWAIDGLDGNSFSVHCVDGDCSVEGIDVAFCISLGLVLPPPEQTGACCHPDLTCTESPLSECQGDGDLFIPQGDCDIPGTCPEPCDNNTCPTAIDLNDPASPGDCGDGTPCCVSYTNQLCPTNVRTVQCQVQPGGPVESSDFGSDKWWTYSTGPSESGEMVITQCPGENCLPTSFDAIMAVYDGGTDCSVCPTSAGELGTPDECGDDTCGVGGGPPMVTLNALANHCYFIRTGGWDGEQGIGSFTITFGGEACAPAAKPVRDDRFNLAGTVQACANDAACRLAGPGDQADCIDGFCYVRMNRYLGIEGNPANQTTCSSGTWGWRLTADVGGTPAALGWVDTPFDVIVAGPESNPQKLARLTDQPVYRDWAADGQPIIVGDCETQPNQTYYVEAICEGCDINDPANYSPALTLRTVLLYGDVTGASPGSVPNNVVDFRDIAAMVGGFQSLPTVPKRWLDLVPTVPNFSDGGISFSDVNQVVAGFQGQGYPYPPPWDCP